MASWPEHAIWWQVYPLGFTGAFPEHPAPAGDGAVSPGVDVVSHGDGADGAATGAGDARPAAPGTVRGLTALIPWLDDVLALGCNGLLLGPIFASETHGYDTTDHWLIDARLGGDDGFDLLVAECRRRGIRLLLDGVFNHVGRSHPWWQAALAGDTDARRRFATTDGAPLALDGSNVVAFEGHGALVTLDHTEPAVVDEVAAIMTHWLDRGADGWRLDAAYAVDPDFWRAVLGRVREQHPEAWFVGEVLHGDYVDYVERSALDSVTQYELWKAIRSSIDERNLFELAWSLGRHNGFVESFLPQTFVGNHDVTRIASAIGDARHHAHALALLLFLPGAPSIYYGDERGFEAVKEERMGGDDAIRPEYPSSPAELGAGASVFALHQELIGFRRRNAWLVRARVEVSELANETAVFRATGADGQTFALALNLSDADARLGGQVVAAHSWAHLR